MAQKTLDREAFFCPICLDLLEDPVTIPCGHSYCMKCAENHWRHQRGRYSCPECRKSFRSRPALVKNIMLAVLVEQLKKTAPPADHCYAEPKHVSCDVCIRRKLKAVKLVAPSDKLQENICSEHSEVKKMFCRTDQELICAVCCMDQHKDHDTVSALEEKVQRQAELKIRRDQLVQAVQDKETNLEKLRKEAQDISCSAQEAVQRSETSFTEVIHLLEKRRSKVKQEIWSEEKTELSRVQKLQDKLQRDVTELKKTISELDALSLITDHNHFLQQCPSLSTATQTPHCPRIQTGSRKYFEDVSTAVSELSDKLQLSLNQCTLPQPEPTTRAGFLKHACDITLDPDTAHTGLSLSADNREATLKSPGQSYPDHPDRFTHYRQVLSREGLTGCCYWEVEWSREGCVRIALSYKDIQRKGNSNECAFGNNDKSWVLSTDNNGNNYSFWFNKEKLQLSGPVSSRIGVYLDHSAGVLSFYSVSRTMTLLHRVQTTFTQPLHVGLWFYWGYTGNTVYFSKLKNNPFISFFL